MSADHPTAGQPTAGQPTAGHLPADTSVSGEPPAGRSGLLLVNLGTPDAPTTPAVRKYLREFLSDPLVIDIPAIARALLVNAIIVPFRSPKSAQAYQAIWTEQGSPLLVHTTALANEVRTALSPMPVEFAMRYGKPSIATAMASLREAGVTQLTVFALYPQETQSSTGSTRAKIDEVLEQMAWAPDLVHVRPFHDHAAFLDAEAEVVRGALADYDPDLVLFSFHGLPERHIHKADPSGSFCLAKPDCCASLNDQNLACYRAQCYATARGIAERLGLPPDRYSVAFQSRLGRTPWIQPFTDVVLMEQAQAGAKRIAVACPAFVADCLETLEEIGIRADHDFRAAGGESVRLIPSLNAHPQWVDAVVQIAREAMGEY